MGGCVGAGVGVAVGLSTAVGVGVGLAVGMSVAAGAGVGVGIRVGVGTGVAAGVGAGVAVAVGSGIDMVAGTGAAAAVPLWGSPSDVEQLSRLVRGSVPRLPLARAGYLPASAPLAVRWLLAIQRPSAPGPSRLPRPPGLTGQ